MRKIISFAGEAIRCLDPILFVCSTLLSLLSILTIAGAVDNFGMTKLKTQLFIFILGTILTVFIAFFDYRPLVRRLWKYLLFGSVALLVLTLIVGTSGASMETANKSWLKIPGTGFMIQPSEFVKFAFICTFALHLFAVGKQINHPLSVLFLGLHAALIVGPILLSGDLGVFLVYFALILAMLYCAGLHPLYFLAGAVLIVIAAPFLWDHLELYQQQRILVGFHPENDPLGKGMQPLMSRAAIANGGLLGKGLFGGYYYEILPASHTDFIYATVCEKFGFLGGAGVIGIFVVMVVRIFRIARKASRTDFGGLICVGVGGMLIVQILLNIGMCFAVLPVIGITLPFVSCGGSSMLATYLMFGLVQSVRSHSEGLQDEREKRRLHFD